ncbi:MAG: ribosomal protein S12 methylthiotransferase accessory factor [Candidatus Electronema aureum]|uniref:Ribosomal protein S12 methylthiotransferase accessory factor n=1 Tax=Candidatus Electronema aureum TaxID=2005002 RepID=A0A521G3Q1_9BACT|nr:MAG: ribosomal protein S12 methylthiotransferase accessory factor [Candidatus Electronema aureum]
MMMSHLQITPQQRGQEKLLDEFVSTRLGPVRNLYELTREPDAPDIFSYVSELCDMTQFSFQQSGTVSTGIGITRFHARTAAIGEALERYASGFYNPQSQVRLASYKELRADGLRAAHPSDFGLYSEQQYQQCGYLRRFTEETRIGWAKSVALTDSHAEVWLPACFVFLPYTYMAGETQISSQISTGLSASFDFDTAVMGSICEIVEREAAMLTWLHNLPCAELSFSPDCWFSEVFAQRFARSGFAYRLCHAPGDLGLHTVFAMMVDKGRHVVSTGSSTKTDPQQAALKALLETVQVRELLQSIPKRRTPAKFHLELYQDIPLSPDLHQFFHSGITQHSVGEETALTLPELLANCKQAGIDVYVIDLTTADLADAGLKVVRVVMPQAVRLYREFELPYLGGKRLYEAPARMGFAAMSEAELNLQPHPFG